jgi:hypothetical protein
VDGYMIQMSGISDGYSKNVGMLSGRFYSAAGLEDSQYLD